MEDEVLKRLPVDELDSAILKQVNQKKSDTALIPELKRREK